MWTKRGVHHRCNRPSAAAAPASAREPLPMDVLLEIVARTDVTSIIRCASASKFLRRAILDQAFRRRLELQAAAEGGRGFDPALLFGVSYLAYARLVPAHHLIRTPSLIQLHAYLQACSLLDSFEPVASRDHLLLLRHQPPIVELRVCDTITGYRFLVPNVAVSGAHAFLSVSNYPGWSYELIVMDTHFRFQTLSSKHGHWGAVREASSATTHPRRLDASSRVIGRTVYWLCQLNAGSHCWDGILALDVDAAEATTMKLPPGYSSRMVSYKKDKHLLLASVLGRLGLLVAEACGISMWTPTPPWSPHLTAATWSRQLVISLEEIVRPMEPVSSTLSFVLEGFGERSGAVIVRVDRSDLLRLNLGTKVVTRLHQHNPGHASVSNVFLHETDLASLLKKSFRSALAATTKKKGCVAAGRGDHDA